MHVTNLGQTQSQTNRWGFDNTRILAQSFITGGTSSSRFTLNSVVVDFTAHANQATIKIYTSSSGDPGTQIGGALTRNRPRSRRRGRSRHPHGSVPLGAASFHGTAGGLGGSRLRSRGVGSHPQAAHRPGRGNTHHRPESLAGGGRPAGHVAGRRQPRHHPHGQDRCNGGGHLLRSGDEHQRQSGHSRGHRDAAAAGLGSTTALLLR